DRLAVRVEQQLRRVAAVPLARIERPVDPVPVPLARTHPGQVAVPDEPVHLGQLLPRLPPRLVEQAQLDPPRHLREQREVRARAVPGGAQRIGVTGPNLPHVATPPPVRPGPSIVTYPPSSSPHPPPF